MRPDEYNKTNTVGENAEKLKLEKARIELDRKIRSGGMKRGVITTSVIAFLVLLVAGIVFFSIYKRDQNQLISQMEEQKIALSEKVTARESVISEWITTFDEIEKNIALIKEKEKLISVNSSNSEISKDKRIQVLEDIKLINTLLDQNKKRIASLNAQLQKSGGTIKVLQDKISGLEAKMMQNETEITELKSTLVTKNFEVDQLNTQMVVLQDTIVKKDEKISTQTYEMNKAFYAIGTYKELKANGLLTKEGGFIGLGKTEKLTGNIPDNVFEQIDLTETKSISINSKSAKLISEHAAGSFEFMRDQDKKITSIEIKDPAQFWKISKYAVIEITN